MRRKEETAMTEEKRKKIDDFTYYADNTFWFDVNGYVDSLVKTVNKEIERKLAEVGYIKVVRCKDCKYWSPPRDEEDCGYGWCSLTGYIAVKVDYCSQAERYMTERAVEEND